MIDTHLRIKDDLYKEIKNSSQTNNNSFNEECNRLLKLSLISDDFLSKIEKLILITNQISNNSYISKRLLEQLYSDIGLNITDTNKSKNLQAFYKKIRRGSKYD